MRRDQHSGILPELCRWHALEFADIDVERRAAQMIVLKSIGQSILVDDFAARDIDQDAPRLHRREAVLVEEPGCLRRPLAADHHEVALRQKPVDRPGPGDLAEALRQGRTWLRVAAGAEDPHAKRGAQPAYFEPDPAGANHADGLALYEQWPV